MKRIEIIEMLKLIDPLQIENDGPTAIFLSAKCGKKTRAFSLSGDKDLIIVTTGKYLFKRKYRIYRSEL